jgi:hypothetical protein
MSDISPNTLRGFLKSLKLSDSDLWIAQASVTQQAVRPAQPRPNGDYKLVVTSSGDKPSSTAAIVTTQRSGSAGDENGASFLWKEQGGLNYGYDIGGAISGFEKVEMNTVAFAYENPDSITLENGNSLIVYEQFTAASPTTKGIKLAKRNRESGVWTSSLITTAQAVGADLNPCIAELPNGDLLIAHWLSINTDQAQLKVLRSTDKGDNWITITEAALTTPIATDLTSGYTVGRLRMAANSEHVIIVADLLFNNSGSSVELNRMAQFASSNLGGSFSTVGLTGSGIAYARYRPDIIVDQDGNFKVFYMRTFEQVVMFELPNAYYDISSLDVNLSGITVTSTTSQPEIADVITVGSSSKLEGELSCWMDEEGTIYVALKNVESGSTYEDSLFMRVSRDGGATWHYLNNSGDTTSPRPFYFINDVQSMPVGISGSTNEGRQLIVSKNTSSGATHDNSISAIYLGGYSTRTLHSYVDLPKWYQHGALDYTYLPFDIPQDTPIFSVTGSGTEALVNLALEITTSIANPNRYYAHSPATTPAQGFIFHAGFSTDSGYSTYRPVAHLRTNDSSLGYEIQIQVSATNIKIRDMVASADIATAAIDTTGLFEILVSMRGSSIEVYYQKGIGSGSAYLGARKTYSSISGTMSSDGGGGTASFIRFGHVPTAVAARVSSWSWFNFAFGASTGQGIDSSIPVEGRLYPISSKQVYLYDGLSISTKDGPAFSGDEYTIEQDSDYPMTRLFPSISSSPRVQWRSLAVSSGNVTEQFIPFYLDTTVEENSDSDIGGDLIGLYLGGINFQYINIEYYRAGVGWTVYEANLDLAKGLSFTGYRVGSTVYAQSPAIDQIYLQENEAAGWILRMESGGSNTYREIISNTSGLLTSATGKRAVLKLRDVNNGSDPVNSTAYLIPSSVAISANLLGVQGAAWAIRIPAQETKDNDFRIGAFLFGSIDIEAPQYSRGRSISYEANTEIYISPDLGVRSRSRSAGRRSLSVAWSSGVSSHDLYLSTPDPDYWTASSLSGALPVASYGEVATKLEGLARYLEGGSTPTVYFPAIERATTSALKIQVHNRRESFIYCYLDSPVTYENVLGDELENEVMRIASMQFRELI